MIQAHHAGNRGAAPAAPGRCDDFHAAGTCGKCPAWRHQRLYIKTWVDDGKKNWKQSRCLLWSFFRCYFDLMSFCCESDGGISLDFRIFFILFSFLQRLRFSTYFVDPDEAVFLSGKWWLPIFWWKKNLYQVGETYLARPFLKQIHPSMNPLNNQFKVDVFLVKQPVLI